MCSRIQIDSLCHLFVRVKKLLTYQPEDKALGKC